MTMLKELPHIVISESSLSIMTSLFVPYRRREVESCCLWYGPKLATGGANVTTIVVPEQINRFGSFHLSSKSIGHVADATRPLGLVAKAQIHTHPGFCVDHSFYDDENVISRRVLSLVIPDYGQIPPAWPDGVGVHAFLGEQWQRLPDTDARNCFTFQDTGIEVLDLR